MAGTFTPNAAGRLYGRDTHPITRRRLLLAQFFPWDFVTPLRTTNHTWPDPTGADDMESGRLVCFISQTLLSKSRNGVLTLVQKVHIGVHRSATGMKGKWERIKETGDERRYFQKSQTGYPPIRGFSRPGNKVTTYDDLWEGKGGGGRAKNEQ